MLVFVIISLICIVVWSLGLHLIFKDKIPTTEALLQAGISTVVAIVGIFIVYHADMGDKAVINGYITGKDSYHVPCSHSYTCNCITTCNGKGSCSTICQTCFEHSFDKNWRAKSTVGNFNIDRIDRQGLGQPPRWSSIQEGEPAANTVSYINYIKGSPNSLFAMNKREDDALKYPGMFPNYPKPFDYYRFNRVLQVKASYPQAAQLNGILNDTLRKLGAAKQVNIVVVFAGTTDPMYRFALERAWIGGKKNDVILLVGLDKQNTFAWVDTITFGKNSGNELLAVKLRDSVKQLVVDQQLGSAPVLAKAITDNIQSDFHRKEMKDFEYLKNTYQPSTKAIVFYMIFQFLVLTAGSIFFYNFDLQSGQWANNRRYGSYNSYSRYNRY